MLRTTEAKDFTSPFTQLLGSHKKRSSFSVALCPQRPWVYIRDGEPRTSTSTFTQLLISGNVFLSFLFVCLFLCVFVFCFSWCFTSTETVRFIRDGGRMGQGMRAQAHLPVHTAPELCLETPLNAASYVSKTDFAGWDRSQNVDGLSQKHSPLFFFHSCSCD